LLPQSAVEISKLALRRLNSTALYVYVVSHTRMFPCNVKEEMADMFTYYGDFVKKAEIYVLVQDDRLRTLTWC
jgi:hypothetical protein